MPEKFHPIIPLSNGKSGLSDKLKTTTTKTTTIVFVCTFKSTQYRPFTNVYSGSRFQVSFLVLFVMLTKHSLCSAAGAVFCQLRVHFDQIHYGQNMIIFIFSHLQKVLHSLRFLTAE